MTSTEFKIKHSELIEQFQWIEFNFKKIIIGLNGEGIISGLDALNKDAWGRLMDRVYEAEQKAGTRFFSNSLYDELDDLREERNYWCHQCYLDVRFKRDGTVRSSKIVQKLDEDYRKATELQDRTQEIFDKVLRKLLKKETPWVDRG